VKPFLMTVLRFAQCFIREYFRQEVLPLVCWRGTFEEVEIIKEDGEPVLKVTLTVRWDNVTEEQADLTKKIIEKTKYGLLIHGVCGEEDL